MGYNEKVRFKYGNRYVKALVDGVEVTFKSELEYRYAKYLDILKEGGKIKDWDYEGKIRGWGNHQFVFDKGPEKYIPDFCVRNNDDSFEYHETKGQLQGYDIRKYKQLHNERPEVKLTIIFARKPKISVNKKDQLERYTHRVVWEGKKELFKPAGIK